MDKLSFNLFSDDGKQYSFTIVNERVFFHYLFEKVKKSETMITEFFEMKSGRNVELNVIRITDHFDIDIVHMNYDQLNELGLKKEVEDTGSQSYGNTFGDIK